MTPDRWQRVNDVFLRVVGAAAERRADVLHAACGDDAQLRHDVEKLLAHDDTSGAFNHTPIPLGKLFTDGEANDRWIGQTVGNYVVRRLIGRGGMGSVYLAERVADYEQQVAIKVLHHVSASGDSLRRFQAEVQFLATMGKHPNIAGLLDAGHTSDGSPYFVMEYVDGQRLDRYCDEHRLNTRQRLDLFRTICGAVQFAHQHTVIHRDLKPSNILVRSDGSPKLIDFGIAKLVQEDTAGDATRTEFRAFTPDYASPEQLRGKNVTTASDIYSLGVILYELLTGHRPFSFNTSDLIALAKAITECEPERPSTVIDRPEEMQSAEGQLTKTTAEDISLCRDATPHKLRRQLSGDLDNIVLMALRKEPARRYASVDQFAADIGRHLTGHPVIARPDTLTYRTGKFLKRNWPAVTAAGVMLVLLVGGIISTSWQWFRANRLARQAQQEAATAKAVNEFFVLDMISSANPERRPRNITLNQVLEKAAQRIGARFKDQPELEATIRQTLGDALLHVGNYHAAEEQLRQTIALREVLAGPDDRATLKAKTLLGDVLDCLERFEEAEPLLRTTCERMSETLGADDADTLQAQAKLGEMLQTMGKHDEAQKLLRLVIEVQLVVLGADDPRRGSALNSLGASYQAQQKYVDAEKAFGEYVAICERMPADQAMGLTTGLNQLGSLNFRQGKFTEAEPYFRRLVEIAPQRLPADHPDLARFYGNYGVCLTKLGRNQEAEPFVLKAYEVSADKLGADHSQTIVYLTNVYGFYYGSGQVEKATAHHIREIKTQLRSVKMDDNGANAVQRTVDRYAKIFTDRGQPEKIQSLYEELIRYVETELPADHPGKWKASAQLGVALGRAGQFERAERLLKQSLEAIQQSAAPGKSAEWLSQQLEKLSKAKIGNDQLP